MISLGLQAERADATVQIPPDLRDPPVGGGVFASAAGAAVAAVEAVSGRLANHMSTASVTGPRWLTSTVLREIGWSWVQNGESLHCLIGGRLVRAATWEVTGGPFADEWQFYSIDFAAPAGSSAPRMPASHCVHLRRDPDLERPWRGSAPLDRAGLTRIAAATAEDALGLEARMPSTAVVPMPWSVEGVSPAALIELRAKIVHRGSQILTPPTTQRRGSDIPQTDWQFRRVKAEPSPALVDLAAQAQARVCSAMGVHPALIAPAGGNGSVDKEAFRQFHDLLAVPLGRAIEREAARVSGQSCRLRWPVGDDRLLIRTRAYDALRKAGIDHRAAWMTSRLDESQPLPKEPEPPAPPPQAPPAEDEDGKKPPPKPPMKKGGADG